MLRTHPIPAFSDNYLWVIHAPAHSARVAVVDPGDAAPVQAYLEAQDLELAAILITHKHPDHIGGVATLAAAHPEALVVGPDHPAMPALDQVVADGDTVELEALGLSFEVLAVPGHTLEHLAYLGHGHLFIGDTLFAYGCGRLFEGTPAQMLASLDRVAALPEDTVVHPTHEYTEANLRFARSVLPEDAPLAQAEAAVRELRTAGQPSLPTTIAEQRRANPFLRVDEAPLRAACEAHADRSLDDRVAVFAELRSWKDGS